jgi:histidinol-phosphatase (PHP family)
MIVDYHTHTSLCKHGEGDVEEYIRKALALGLDEIGCSEHMPMPDGFDLRHRMSLEEYYASYAPRISVLAEQYKGRIAVRRGLEAEFLPGADAWIEKFIEENDFDYVIGSVHFLGKWGEVKPLFHAEYSEQEIERLHIEYFEAICASAMCRRYDIIGHCDLIKKFGIRSTPKIEESCREALKAIRSEDIAIEINTSGLRKAEQDTYPGKKILQWASDLNIPLTIGSDAHKPEQVGLFFDRAVALVEEFGRGRISLFERRQRTEVRISRLEAA